MTPVVEDTPVNTRWWKDKGVVVGLVGVVATIAVGFGTYKVTDTSASSAYRDRIRTARGEVLAAVSRSIGEGVVPNKEKLQAVMRSARRQHDIREEDFDTVEMVLDDVVARVLSNEFLDAKRREELSTRLLDARNAKEPEPPQVKTGLQPTGRTGSEFTKVFLAVASATFFGLLLRLFSVVARRSRYSALDPIPVMIAALVLAFTVILFPLLLNKPPLIQWLFSPPGGP